MINKKEPVAVVGVSGIFPEAGDIKSFWENIVTKKDAICTVPEHRWILPPDSITDHRGKPDTVFHKKAGLVNDFIFSTEGLEMDPALLNALDPMFHFMLSAGRDAFREARTNPKIKQRTGVILAAIALPTDTASAFTRTVIGKSIEKAIFSESKQKKINPETILSSRVTAMPAAILARSLSLGGGSLTLDAACSSSLYAIKLACDQLHSKKCDMIIAGGVSRPESLFTQAGFTQLTALSPSGICAPFDASADGLVVGEGAGAIAMKRLGDAINAGDTIYGIIHGSGLSNDIGGNLLAPDTEGQLRAMRAAYKAAGWSPQDIGHIECHGTGTPTGDKTEIQSLFSLWRETGDLKGNCAIGSIKSMIGHLLTAAGIAGTIKTLLALKNKTIPPSINFSAPAPGSPLENGPFYVPVDPSPWEKKRGLPRRAAMSAFGFGGINAHILVEEWNEKNPVSVAIPPLPCSTEKTETDIAIVGIGTFISNAESQTDFRNAVLDGKTLTDNLPSKKKWFCSEKTALELLGEERLPYGNYFESFNVYYGEFHIPPNELPDILPQHLLMLKAAASAIEDAGIEKRSKKPEMGAAIGMNFDYEATNFHLRWNLPGSIDDWNEKYGLGLSDTEKKEWCESILNKFLPPLTPSRTTGASVLHQYAP